MADSLFLITGGGTGAKVAEALVHLCAAGLAPRTVHILIVDADTTNGNVRRAQATADAYRAMQRWPWAVEATLGGGFLGLGKKETASLQLFASELVVTALTEPLDTTQEGGIRASATSDDMRLVLDLLYDREEQTAPCDDGFRARPNLGCLVLAEHLNSRLPTTARPFLDALVAATMSGGTVPVVVTASIFGGTGASLLPVVRGAVEQALRDRDAERAAKALRWGSVMILPHYLPKARIESVDPDRYLLDTANALQFYGMAQGAGGADLYDAVYAVGSDRPARNLVRPVLGQRGQANPAYIEELVGALGALHFAETLGRGGKRVRVYDPARGADRLGWGDLPLGADNRLLHRFAYLLHLAAFHLRPADANRPDLTKGLDGLLAGGGADLEAYAWFKHVLDPWAAELSPTYRQTPPGRRAAALRDPNVLGERAADALRPDAAAFFGRLLLWAASALRDGDVLHLLTHLTGEDYTLLQGEMGRIKTADVSVSAEGAQTFDPAADNALARLLRTALAAAVSAHERTRAQDGRVAGTFALAEADRRIGLRITPQQVAEALGDARLGAVPDEYTGTAA
jgi:hypothetical protein